VLKLLSIFNFWSSANEPSDLYENGIVDVLRSLFNELKNLKKSDDKSITDSVIQILKILDNLLKYVSEFVKRALQVKYFCNT
jgi:hypothetical protein